MYHELRFYLLNKINRQLHLTRQRAFLLRIMLLSSAVLLSAILPMALPRNNAVEIIPNCISLSDYTGYHTDPQPNTLIFTGSFTYAPNYRAMDWFVREVYPTVIKKCPEINLTITGDHASRKLSTNQSIKLSGFVDDVRQLVARSYISLAPIWNGGGTRLKILEAMALRTPVVSTSKGAEGLEVEHRKHLLIADSPESFAEMVVCLLEDPVLHQQLADNAYQLMQEKYDWAVVMPRFLDLVERVAAN